MPRIARIIGTEHPHHIVQRGNNRQAIFFDDPDRERYLSLLIKYAKECLCKISSYCLMENHTHLLLNPEKMESLAKMMQKLSLTFTQYINKKYNRTGRLWECRFYSSIIDKESYLLSVCRYIERNPVRAKLVKSPLKYKWSSAKYILSEDSVEWLDPAWADYYTRDEYIKFLNQQEDKEDVEKIRRSVFKGMPLGTAKFIKEISEKSGILLDPRPRGRPPKK